MKPWEDGLSAPHKRPLVLRILARVVLAVALLLLALAVFLAAAVRHPANGETTLLGRPAYSVMSGSMSPTIRTGDLIIDQTLTSAQAAELHKGQIITFQAAANSSTGGLVITHRIYAVVHEESATGAPVVAYRTKGDANNSPDVSTVPSSAVLGLYTGTRVPFGAYVLSTLHQPVTFIVLVMIPILYIAEELVRRKWMDLGDREMARRARAQGAGQNQ